MITWDVKTDGAGGNKLADGTTTFAAALKSAGFEADSFEVKYEDDKITISTDNAGKNRISAFKLTGAATTATTKLTPETADGKNGLGKAARGVGAALKLQIGDTNDEFNKISVDVKEISVEGLGIVELDISTQEAAGASISKIKSAIESVSKTRSDMGALQNRLGHVINNLGVATENMTDSESRIRDVDMAHEMMVYTKNNILTQAAQAMLAQANQLPQGVLQLLR